MRVLIPYMLLAMSSWTILSAQQTIYVLRDAGSIQAGIALAKNGDTVQVAHGTYNENIDFLGKNIIVTSGAKNSDEAEQTVLNASQDGPLQYGSTAEKAVTPS